VDPTAPARMYRATRTRQQNRINFMSLSLEVCVARIVRDYSNYDT
jgi:hypothetical protein